MAALSLETAVPFMLAGCATFTVVSAKTGERFTYRLEAPRTRDGHDLESPLRFLHVLTGPDNRNDYRFAGTVIDGRRWKASPKAGIQESAPSVRAFRWVLDHVLNGAHLVTSVQIHHAGTCGRCGRQLTTPPECPDRPGTHLSGKDGTERLIECFVLTALCRVMYQRKKGGGMSVSVAVERYAWDIRNAGKAGLAAAYQTKAEKTQRALDCMTSQQREVMSLLASVHMHAAACMFGKDWARELAETCLAEEGSTNGFTTPGDYLGADGSIGWTTCTGRTTWTVTRDGTTTVTRRGVGGRLVVAFDGRVLEVPELGPPPEEATALLVWSEHLERLTYILGNLPGMARTPRQCRMALTGRWEP